MCARVVVGRRAQGTVSVTAIGTDTLITPPYTQLHFDVEFSAGLPPISTVGDPGIHGAGVIGVQGPGVSTPKAAAVSVAVAGLANDMHVPNGMMLRKATLSMIVAIGFFSAIVLPTGSTVIGAGAAPIGHISMSPFTTGCAMGAG